MIGRFSVQISLLLMLLGSPVHSLFASTVIDVPQEEVAQAARWIARIQVTKVQSLAGGKVQTAITGKVLEIFKGEGSSGEHVTFSIPGGTVGKKRLVVMGMSQFREGGEYIVFLETSPRPVSQNAVSFDGRLASLQNWTSYKVLQSKVGNKYVIRNGSVGLARPNSQGALSFQHSGRDFKTYEAFVTDLFRDLN